MARSNFHQLWDAANIICNVLSRSGFETALVDHTGIDVIAVNPNTKQRLGITVKSRTRDKRKKERDSVHIFNNRKNDQNKLEKACEAFDCKPWIAIYVETKDFADVYLTSLENYDMKYRGRGERTVDDWKMGVKAKQDYAEDPNIKHIRIDFHFANWDW